MKKTLLVSALALAGTIGFSSNASAANITLMNGDAGTTVGLNDATPTAPKGGNPGKTIGEQRRITYQFAMDLWGSVLRSDVEIKVYASFARLACLPTGTTLGQAGTNWIAADFPGATPDTIYHSALADAIAGFDLMPIPVEGIPPYYPADPTNPADIFSQFNGDLGKSDCAPGLNWYYGLDGITPAGSINFLNVVMHEIGHGLGVSGFVGKTSGALYAGLTDVYTHNAYDNVENKRFDDPAMTNALRAAAIKTPGRTVWQGYQVNAQAPLVLNPRQFLTVTAPAGIAGRYLYGGASFGPAATPTNFAGSVVLGQDAAPSATDACTPLVNDVAGKIVLVDRGVCPFTVKAANVQAAGGIAMIVADNAAGSPPPDLAGSDPSIAIPAIRITLADGITFKANLPASVSMVLDQALMQGADDAGRVRLYAPSEVSGGSSFSHFDTALTPNALMEPFDTPEVQSQVDVDLTPALFTDIGWTLNTGNATIAGCDTTVDAVEEGGLVLGASLSAYSNMCAVSARGSRASYLRCVSDQAFKLQQMGAITSNQYLKVRQCAMLVRP